MDFRQHLGERALELVRVAGVVRVVGRVEDRAAQCAVLPDIAVGAELQLDIVEIAVAVDAAAAGIRIGVLDDAEVERHPADYRLDAGVKAEFRVGNIPCREIAVLAEVDRRAPGAEIEPLVGGIDTARHGRAAVRLRDAAEHVFGSQREVIGHLEVGLGASAAGASFMLPCPCRRQTPRHRHCWQPKSPARPRAGSPFVLSCVPSCPRKRLSALT